MSNVFVSSFCDYHQSINAFNLFMSQRAAALVHELCYISSWNICPNFQPKIYFFKQINFIAKYSQNKKQTFLATNISNFLRVFVVKMLGKSDPVVGQGRLQPSV